MFPHLTSSSPPPKKIINKTKTKTKKRELGAYGIYLRRGI